MAKEKENKEPKDLQSTLSAIQKDMGEGIVSYGADELGNLGTIPFGILSLDKATCIGGIPKGRVTEIFGMDGTFKSTLSLCLIEQCQKSGGTAAFIDAEYAFSPEYAETLGVNNEKLILVHPASAEECFSVIERLVDSGQVDIIVLDSVAALSPSTELANEFGSSNMAVMARLMGQFFRKITAKIGKTGTTLVLLNQLREMLGGYVPMKTTPAGNATKFYASMRFEISKSSIKEGTEVKGVTLKVKVIKNKLGIPYLNTELEAIFGYGIDKLKDLINVAISENIITKAGAGWLTYKDIKIQGIDKFKELLLDNDELRIELINKIKNDK